jgi:hypothetical protein
VDWIVRFVRFHSMRSRENLLPAEAKIESFLTDLAVHADVAPATQNQANGSFHGFLEAVLMDMMPSDFSRSGVFRQVFCGRRQAGC